MPSLSPERDVATSSPAAEAAATPARPGPDALTAPGTTGASDPTATPGFAPSLSGKAVLVHGGARDAYQMALALCEAGLLEALVTDLFWPEDRGWAKALARRLPESVLHRLRLRSAVGLPGRSVATCLTAGLGGLFMDRAHWLPFALRRRWTRASDAKLGTRAGQWARRTGAGLVSYSYYGYDAFTAFGRGGLLFQVHPHPATMRRILREELQRHPDCASSLKTEWEMSLPEDDFQHLVSETGMASRYLAASSFTRRSLIENGAAPDTITVIPYGVDLKRFKPSSNKRATRTSRLRLLFVGRINQRKGVKYLLEALRLVNGKSGSEPRVDLTICGRAVDDLQLFAPYRSQIAINVSVGAADLVRAYQTADLFIFPSVGEGFGQVLLESLACGLPILSTTHTAAPDLIQDGVQGFIVEPRRPDLLADRIDWSIRNRNELLWMGEQARVRAEHFTWQRFRQAAAAAVGDYLRAERVQRPELKREVAACL